MPSASRSRGDPRPLGERHAAGTVAGERMERRKPRRQRVAERANGVRQRSGIQLVVVRAVVDPERLEHSALLANDGFLRVLRREHVREEGVVAMARQADSHGDLRRRHGRGGAPRRLAQHRDVVLSLAHLVHRAEEAQTWGRETDPPAATRRDPPRSRAARAAPARRRAPCTPCTKRRSSRSGTPREAAARAPTRKRDRRGCRGRR